MEQGGEQEMWEWDLGNGCGILQSRVAELTVQESRSSLLQKCPRHHVCAHFTLICSHLLP